MKAKKEERQKGEKMPKIYFTYYTSRPWAGSA